MLQRALGSLNVHHAATISTLHMQLTCFLARAHAKLDSVVAQWRLLVPAPNVNINATL
jgi:hypothetical protein